MKAIVGLGNPGPEYRGTRHNVGFDAINCLADRFAVRLRSDRRVRSVAGEGEIAGERVILAQPQTFMNLSGAAVSALLRQNSLSPADLIVISDDVHLALGRIRLRRQGSHGGHNGLRDVISALGASEFSRVRIGVGAPEGQELIDHVLGRFHPDDWPAVRESVHRAADAVEILIREGFDAAANQFNPGGDRL